MLRSKRSAKSTKLLSTTTTRKTSSANSRLADPSLSLTQLHHSQRSPLCTSSVKTATILCTSSVKTATILCTSSVKTATVLCTSSVKTATVLCPHQSKWPPYVHLSQNGHYTVFTSTSVERRHSKDILLGDARKEAGLYQQLQRWSSTSEHSLAHSFQGQLLQPMAELLASPQGVVANGVLFGKRLQLRGGPQEELHGCRRCCWYGSLKVSKGN